MAAVIFLVVFILAAVLITELFQAPVETQLRAESQKITETVASGVGPGAFLDGTEMDAERVTDLLEMSYADLKVIYGTRYDFCVYFEDQNGSLIMINETSAGLGDPSVNVSGLPCGLGPAVPAGCDEDNDGSVNDSAFCGGLDCNDRNQFIRPGVPEICNLVDDDCDLIVDEGCVACSNDDGDDFSDTAGCGLADCCDDGTEGTLGCAVATRASIYPGAAEVCGDGIDQDCSGADQACPPPTPCTDADGDGRQDPNTPPGCSLGTSPDCCDAGTEPILGCTAGNRSLIYSGAMESPLINCDDGIDQDCSGADVACAPLPPGVPFLSCSWQPACSGADMGAQITILKAFKTANSHVGDYASSYPNFICCDINAPFTIGHGCAAPNGTTVVKISGATNAHAQAAGGYPVDVCLNATGGTPACTYRAGASCDVDETCIMSMSAATNAMVGSCVGGYSNYLCCRVT